MGGKNSVPRRAVASAAIAVNVVPTQPQPPLAPKPNLSGRTVVNTYSGMVDVNHIPLTPAQIKAMEKRVAFLEEDIKRGQEVIKVCDQLIAIDAAKTQYAKEFEAIDKQKAWSNARVTQIDAEVGSNNQIIATGKTQNAAIAAQLVDLDDEDAQDARELAELEAQIAAEKTSKQQTVTV